MVRTMVKVVLALAAAGLFAFGGICIRSAIQLRAAVKEMERPLIDMPIDLSRPGEYSQEMPPVKEYFHGLALRVRIPAGTLSNRQPDQLLAGLRGEVIVNMPDGKVIHRFGFSEEDFLCPTGRDVTQGSLYFAFVDRIPQYAGEQSRLTVRVDQSGAALAGVEQTLTAAYALCGLDSLNVLILAGIGTVSVLAGLGIAIPVAVSLRKPKKVNLVQPDDPGDIQHDAEGCMGTR